MSKPTFKTLPAHCRIVEPARRSDSTTQALRLRHDQPPPAPITPPEPVVPVAGPKRDETKRKEDQRPALLRPACAATSWPGIDGLRFVAHALTLEQARSFVELAAEMGIPVQP